MNELFMLPKLSKNLKTKMKNRILFSIQIISVILVMVSCMQNQKSPVLTFNKDIVDFGQIKSDSVLKIYFEYQNDGDDSLKLINATFDCGCTSVNYEKRGIAPGNKGAIEVIYLPKSNNDSGFVSKNIALLTNMTTPIKVIKFKGVIIK